MINVGDIPISFPHLGGLTLDFKNYFLIFGYPIYWYAVIICIGVILAYLYANNRCELFNIPKDSLLDGLIIGVPVAIVGSRLVYVIGAPRSEISSFADIFRIRDGGLSIFGAIVFIAVFLIIFCRVKKLRLGNVLDITSLGFLIGQIIGRWGNFVNREVYGVATTLPWGMKIGNITRHPLFLYESLFNLIGFLILHKYSKKRKFPGEVALLYMVWYGIGRALLEGLRETSYILKIGDLAFSRLISITLAVIAVFILVVKYIEYKKLDGNVSFEYESPEQLKKNNLFEMRRSEKAAQRKSEYRPMYNMTEPEDGDQPEAGGEPDAASETDAAPEPDAVSEAETVPADEGEATVSSEEDAAPEAAEEAETKAEPEADSAPEADTETHEKPARPRLFGKGKKNTQKADAEAKTEG